uniref:SCP domain-containing protein n=1 Tax=Mesocestoides corti TaxID=53468 RepID=A0A5K3FIJ5_MESCO
MSNGRMRYVLCLLALLWSVAADVPTDEERNTIMKLLTEIRGSVEPPASNMMFLDYSFQVESIVLKWITNCSYLPPLPEDLPSNVSDISVFNEGPKPTYEYVITQLGKEKAFYDYDKDECTDYCFNYRQMVVATANKVGCAQMKCESRANQSSPTYLTACLFTPSKIDMVDRPYTKGESCSACPKGLVCYVNQCAKPSDIPTTTTTSTTSSSSMISPVKVASLLILLLCLIA